MHVSSDGLALAVTSHRSAIPADFDASDDLEIGHSVSRLGRLIALGFLLILLSAALAFELCGLCAYERAAGCAGVLLFGFVTCRLIWMLPAERGHVVIVSRYGIRDLRIGNEFLLWGLDRRRFGARKPRMQNHCVDADAGIAAATWLRQEQTRDLATG